MPWTAYRPHIDGQVKFELPNTRMPRVNTTRTRSDPAGPWHPLRDQAVICRSHNILAHFTKALEDAGVPVLYLGDIFQARRGSRPARCLSCRPKGGTALLASLPRIQYQVKTCAACSTQPTGRSNVSRGACLTISFGISKKKAPPRLAFHSHLQGISDDTSPGSSFRLLVKSNLRPLLWTHLFQADKASRAISSTSIAQTHST
jgi:hypothetical protein